MRGGAKYGNVVKGQVKRQRIAAMLIEAYHDNEMAKELKCTISTVKKHMHILFCEYGLQDFSGDKRVRLAVLLYNERRAYENKSVMDIGRDVMAGHIRRGTTLSHPARLHVSDTGSAI